MAHTIFFSWQSDRATRGGRNLIERALEKAVGKIGADAGVEEAIRELEVDKDTKGVPGSPPIVDTIFRKIEAAAVFVPDLTFVASRPDGRPSPNPNVLVEYGWALRALGHCRIVPVMNTAYGEPSGDAMPFDMRHLRNPIQYCCPDDADEKTRREVREALAKELEVAVRAVLNAEDFKASLPQPSAPAPFPAMEPKDGRARFRAAGEPIGYDDWSLRFAPDEKRGDGRVLLAPDAAMWLRLMPAVDVSRTWKIAELDACMRSPEVAFLPLYSRGGEFNYLHGEDGVGCFPVAVNGTASAIVYAFDTGEVWTVDCRLMRRALEHNSLPWVEEHFSDALDRMSNFLGRLGVDGPYRWIAGIEGVRGLQLVVPPQRGHGFISLGETPTCAANLIEVEGGLSTGAKPKEALKPFFEEIFDKCGVVRPSYLDAL